MNEDELYREMEAIVIPLNNDIQKVLMKYEGPAEIGAMVLARGLVIFAIKMKGKKKAPQFISDLINDEIRNYDDEVGNRKK